MPFPSHSYMEMELERKKIMLLRTESWCFSSYKKKQQIIESILNSVGVAKSPIYCKHLISSRSKRLELARDTLMLVWSFCCSKLTLLLLQWTIQMNAHSFKQVPFTQGRLLLEEANMVRSGIGSYPVMQSRDKGFDLV